MAVVDGHIQCSTCRELKTLDAYQPSIVAKGCGQCRPCKYDAKQDHARRNRKQVNEARNKHRIENRDKHRETMRAHYRNNPELYRGYNLSRYDITADEYDTMLAAQGGGCAICGTKSNRDGKRLFVDHCHESGKVRGILCRKCNSGIGALGDSIEGVQRAVKYLERSIFQSEPHERTTAEESEQCHKD